MSKPKLVNLGSGAMSDANFTLLCSFLNEVMEDAKAGRIRNVLIQCHGPAGDPRYLIGDDYAQMALLLIKHLLEIVLPDVMEE